MLEVVQTQHVDVGRVLQADLGRHVGVGVIQAGRHRQAGRGECIGGDVGAVGRSVHAGVVGVGGVAVGAACLTGDRQYRVDCREHAVAADRLHSHQRIGILAAVVVESGERYPGPFEPVDIRCDIAEGEVHEERLVDVVLLSRLRIVGRVGSGDTRHGVLHGGEKLVAAVHVAVRANVQVFHVGHRQTDVVCDVERCARQRGQGLRRIERIVGRVERIISPLGDAIPEVGLVGLTVGQYAVEHTAAQDRVVGVSSSRVAYANAVGVDHGLGALLDHLRQQDLERRQDARDTGIQVAAVHAEVVDCQHAVAGVGHLRLLRNRRVRAAVLAGRVDGDVQVGRVARGNLAADRRRGIGRTAGAVVVRDRQGDGVGAGVAVGVGRIGRRAGAAVAESPAVGRDAAVRISGAGAAEADRRARGAGVGAVGVGRRRLVARGGNGRRGSWTTPSWRPGCPSPLG